MKTIELELLPEEAASQDAIRSVIAQRTGWNASDIEFRILKRSIDARRAPVKFRLRVECAVREPLPEQAYTFPKQNVSNAPEVLIIGMGPAGMFAALELIRQGLRPIILERGKPVRERRRDLARLTREHVVDPDSNYCFGEGGAGTYSDGKLYTRSHKRGRIQDILEWFVAHGADRDILIDAHPHIGTNKLPELITRMRETIEECGGAVHFGERVSEFIREGSVLKGVKTASGNSFTATHTILATGHSARDIFELLHHNGIAIEAKPFALGVRVEHPQEVIDKVQYHCDVRSPYLPPASYSLVNQHNGKGTFSFCMCPGGIIAPCATATGEVVTNGWSPSKRDNPYANSGIVTEIRLEDLPSDDPLAGVHFQRAVEQKCWEMAGKTQQVPAQRLTDFLSGKVSSTLPKTSYLPGITSLSMEAVLPGSVTEHLKSAFKAFGKKMSGYLTEEAVVHAVESRTSSPIRIPRDRETLQHTQVSGLYPCGEGAGYAGGIVSAAMDGRRVALAVKASL